MRSAWSIEGCRSLSWHVGTIVASVAETFCNTTMCRVSFFWGQLRKPNKRSQMLTTAMTMVTAAFQTHRTTVFTFCFIHDHMALPPLGAVERLQIITAISKT